jgi:hypothetical protein
MGIASILKGKSMGFLSKVKEEALVRSRRCCCICWHFAGLYTNVHHIVQEADGGANDLDNAIALCLRCHGEVGHYNDRHPIGNKYPPSEVRGHRDAWWKWCETNVSAPLPHDPISVSPTAIRVTGGGWGGQTPLTIHNKSSNVYYAVWVKIAVGIAGRRAEDFAIEGFNSPDALTASIGGVKISGDALVIFGPDESQSDSLYLVISKINPATALTYTVTVQGRENGGCVQIPVMILAFSADLQAPPLIQKPGEVALSFTPPEPMAPRGYRVKLDPL